MSRSVVGLMTGMALGFAGWFGGFTAFLLVGALGALGWMAGRAFGGGADLAGAVDRLRATGRERR